MRGVEDRLPSRTGMLGPCDFKIVAPKKDTHCKYYTSTLTAIKNPPGNKYTKHSLDRPIQDHDRCRMGTRLA